MHNEMWQKWREGGKPENWKVMTKVEHTKRTAEYTSLLDQQNPRAKRKHRGEDDELPPIARPATLPIATNTVLQLREPLQGRKRRKKRKAGKATPSHNNTSDGDAEEADDDESASRIRNS